MNEEQKLIEELEELGIEPAPSPYEMLEELKEVDSEFYRITSQFLAYLESQGY